MQDLLNLEMSRLEFLKFAGASIVSILGFGYIISLVSKMSNNQPAQTVQQDLDKDFGSRKFGM